MGAYKPGKEDSKSVILLLNRDMFKHVKVIVTDNGPAFRNDRLKRWADERNIELRFTAPYHPEANGLAERAIRDVKQFHRALPGISRPLEMCP